MRIFTVEIISVFDERGNVRSAWKKKTIAGLFLVGMVALLSGCATVYRGDDPWLGRDKLYHFTVSGAIGAGTTLAASRNGATGSGAPVIGMTATLGIGAGKECYDAKVKGTFWSLKDFVWDMAGGALGCYLVMQNE
jgi:putative lipoprotein